MAVNTNTKGLTKAQLVELVDALRDERSELIMEHNASLIERDEHIDELIATRDRLMAHIGGLPYRQPTPTEQLTCRQAMAAARARAMATGRSVVV